MDNEFGLDDGLGWYRMWIVGMSDSLSAFIRERACSNSSRILNSRYKELVWR